MDAKDEQGRILVPIDAERCQCEELSGSFMTLGPREMVRCQDEPVYLALAIRDSKFYGAMSLCEKHKIIAEAQEPDIVFQRLFVQPEDGDAEKTPLEEAFDWITESFPRLEDQPSSLIGKLRRAIRKERRTSCSR